MFGVKDGFDIIIGNPPFVVVKKGTYKGYKWDTDLYLLFFELATKNLLKKIGGILSFISPKFYLVNLDNTDMREFFLTKTHILSLTDVSPFDAVTENVITILSNGVPSTHIEVIKENKGKFVQSNIIEISYCLKNPHKEIILGLEPDTIKLLDKISANTIKLGSISKSKRGAEVSNGIIKNAKEGIPALIGKDVQKYIITWDNHFIDKNHKEAKRLKEFFTNDNIVFLRRVGGELTAAVDNRKFLCNKNIYGINISDSYSKNFIVALLNSKLLDFYYKKRFSTKKENAFPEIQTYLFENLPIVLANKE
ncbi:MAG: Eco57I restriction-modification methylase domain-containing protein, partial [Alistipes sp.]|nr:Eco57I restriction-modification methylase domain-containing protein [Alistipes sp.]